MSAFASPFRRLASTVTRPTRSERGIASAGHPLGFVAFLIGALLFAVPAAEAAGPAVTTGEASAIHFDRATVNGTVNPGGAELEECLFEYGETEAPYEQSISCAESPGEIGSGNEDVAVHADISSLSPVTTYHFRLSAKSTGGISHGSDRTFDTTEAPTWKLTVTPNAEYVIPGGHPGVYKIEAENIGNEETSGPVVLENETPDNFGAEAVKFYYSKFTGLELNNFPSPPGFCPTNSICEFPGILKFFGFGGVAPHQKLIMLVRVGVPTGASGPLEDVAKISGGGTPEAEASASNTADAEPALGTLHFGTSATDSSKVNPYTQAGGHPYQFSTEFTFENYSTGLEGETQPWQVYGTSPVGDPKEIIGELPPGLIANPQGVPHCSLAEYFSEECARSTVVGSAGLRAFGVSEAAFDLFEPIFNLQPEGAYPGQLGITVGGAPFIVVTTGLRDGSNYGVSAANVAIQAELTRVRLTLWGVPADPSHDAVRGVTCQDSSSAIWAPKFLSQDQIEQACLEGEGAFPPREARPKSRKPRSSPCRPNARANP